MFSGITNRHRAKRITAYTSAAGAGAFVICNGVKAAVIYKDFTNSPLTLQSLRDDSPSLYNTQQLDIDQDGIYDVSFTLYNYVGDQTDHFEVDKNLAAPNVKILTTDPLYQGDRFYPVHSFETGNILSSQNPEANGHTKNEIRLSENSGLTYFAEPERYLGLVTSGGFNAWIEIQIDTANVKRGKLEIKGYAYENTGKPLPVGRSVPNEEQLESPLVAEPDPLTVAELDPLPVALIDEYKGGEYPEDVVTIPEPSFAAVALGLLSAGALGVATWRRNKKLK